MVDRLRRVKYLQCGYVDLAMQTRVQKWGDSLALRIPQFFAAEVRRTEGAPVEVSLIEGKLVIQPLARPPLTLDDLVQGVTDANLRGEWDTGPVVGREVLR